MFSISIERDCYNHDQYTWCISLNVSIIWVLSCLRIIRNIKNEITKLTSFLSWPSHFSLCPRSSLFLASLPLLLFRCFWTVLNWLRRKRPKWLRKKKLWKRKTERSLQIKVTTPSTALVERRCMSTLCRWSQLGRWKCCIFLCYIIYHKHSIHPWR